MVAPLLVTLPLLTMLAGATPAAAPAPDSVARDTTAARDSTAKRVVRQFPPIEVRAPLHDLRSSETVHLVTPEALATLPADGLVDAVRTQAGVVADGEELHVRGGRAGELDQVVEGLTLNEVLGHRPMNAPLLALRSLELVSGGQDAEHGGALAGVLVLRTQDPTPRWATAWRYSTDAGWDTHYDQASIRVGGPIHTLGLGVVAAADLMADGTWLPIARTENQGSVAGLKIGWRAENRMLGWAKLAPVSGPQRGSLQVFLSRERHQPWDPAWTKDGWYTPCGDPNCATPGWSDTPPADPTGWSRYKAADHLAVTDERRIASIFTLARTDADRRTSLALGWVHATAVRSPDGSPGDGYLYAGGEPVFGVDGKWGDPFYAYWGDDPLYRETRSDEFSIRADQSWAWSPDRTARAGLGVTYDDVSLHELDATVFGRQLDSLRSFHARAPGGFAYAQGRWQYQGMVVNLGLRAQVFSAGSDAPGAMPGEEPQVRWSLSPRLGLAYPISVRDVFSLAYVRLEQDPARQFLYDNRRLTSNRFPLGNPTLTPATAISYQSALKHLFAATWATQLGVFYRNVYGQVGARNFAVLPGSYELRYTNEDEASALGFEVGLMHETGRQRAELHYTWMQTYGSESRPEGDPYGPVRGPQVPPIADLPLSWDRRHSVTFSGFSPLFEHWTFAWSSVIGSALPWTPKPRRVVLDDPSLTNSARLGWTESTDVSLRWNPPVLPIPLTFGLEVRNLFDNRSDRVATLDGYPHAVINTLFDDYGAYRTETGRNGGAYWFDVDGDGTPQWVPVHDPRLLNPPRRVRVSLGAHW